MRGFTLLEMLIALAVGAFLLATLWSLLATYSRLFDAENRKAGNAQLVTGLIGQIEADLHSAILDVNPPPLGVPGPVRRFGFFGDAHTLQVDVAQTVWPQTVVLSDQSAEYGGDLFSAPQAHELRTVRYTFVEPASAELSTGELHAGLTRQELAFDAPYDLGSGTGLAQSFSEESGDQSADVSAMVARALSDDSSSESAPGELALLDPLPVDFESDKVTWMPEVERLEFRYFDGATWTTTWNSLQQKALPLAVEIVLNLRVKEDSSRTKEDSSRTSASSGEEVDVSEDFLGLEDAPPPGVVTQRVVVALPAGQRAASDDSTTELDADFGPMSPGSDAGDSGLGMLDPDALADDSLPDDTALVDSFGGEVEEAAKMRFRFLRRSAGQAAALRARPAIPDQWIRLGP